MFTPYDTLGELEKDWEIPRAEWDIDQWREAALLLSRFAALYEEILQAREEVWQIIESRLKPQQTPRRRGRPPAIRNYLVYRDKRLRRRAAPGRPRKYTPEDDEALLWEVEVCRERLATAQNSPVGRITTKAAIELSLSIRGIGPKHRRSELIRLQKLHSRAKARIAKLR